MQLHNRSTKGHFYTVLFSIHFVIVHSTENFRLSPLLHTETQTTSHFTTCRVWVTLALNFDSDNQTSGGVKLLFQMCGALIQMWSMVHRKLPSTAFLSWNAPWEHLSQWVHVLTLQWGIILGGGVVWFLYHCHGCQYSAVAMGLPYDRFLNMVWHSPHFPVWIPSPTKPYNITYMSFISRHLEI